MKLSEALLANPMVRALVEAWVCGHQNAQECEDCGCWTGGADCPYCIPGAPHPRGRW